MPGSFTFEKRKEWLKASKYFSYQKMEDILQTACTLLFFVSGILIGFLFLDNNTRFSDFGFSFAIIGGFLFGAITRVIAEIFWRYYIPPEIKQVCPKTYFDVFKIENRVSSFKEFYRLISNYYKGK